MYAAFRECGARRNACCDKPMWRSSDSPNVAISRVRSTEKYCCDKYDVLRQYLGNKGEHLWKKIRNWKPPPKTESPAQECREKGLFLSGLIVGFAATLLIVGGIFIAFQIHNIITMKDDVAQVSYGEDSAVNAQTIKKLQLLEDTVKENFYLSEVTNEQLEDGMYRGLMDSWMIRIPSTIPQRN